MATEVTSGCCSSGVFWWHNVIVNVQLLSGADSHEPPSTKILLDQCSTDICWSRMYKFSMYHFVIAEQKQLRPCTEPILDVLVRLELVRTPAAGFHIRSIQQQHLLRGMARGRPLREQTQIADPNT